MSYSIWENRSIIKFLKALRNDEHQKAKHIFNKTKLNMVEMLCLFHCSFN